MMMKAMIKVRVHHEQHTPTLLSLPPALALRPLVEQPLEEALGRNMVRDNQRNTGKSALQRHRKEGITEGVPDDLWDSLRTSRWCTSSIGSPVVFS